MQYIKYDNKNLYIEQVKLQDLADQFETPFYCYSLNLVKSNYQKFASYLNDFYDLLICFAIKSNNNINILRELAKLGAGADCVSVGEIKIALDAKIDVDKIVFSGVAKTKKEIEFAIKSGILQFNVESEEELFHINEIASTLSNKCNVAIRINPNIEAMTHEKITTGLKNNKFGINQEQALNLYKKASKLENINIRGIAVHIGSQITKLKPFEQAFDFMLEFVKKLHDLKLPIETIDLGGGVGINYDEKEKVFTIEEYMKLIKQKFGNIKCKIILEPGRALVASSGLLVSSIIYTKQQNSINFLIIDAGMNNLIRPSLYNAKHNIIPVELKNENKLFAYDIVGPICETSDCFAKDYKLPFMRSKDLIAIKDVGAYGSSMASNYNLRGFAKEICVDINKIYYD